MAYPPATLPQTFTDGTDMGDDTPGSVATGTHVDAHHDERIAINDIVAELGTNPSGGSATVMARLDAIGGLQVGEYFASSGESSIKSAATTAAAAGGGVVWVPAGTHTFASAWSPGDNVWVRGYGRGPCILRHGFSGDFITLGTGTAFSHITVDDTSGSNTGKGMKITGAQGSQILEHVNVLGFSSACLSFDHIDAGSGILVIGGRYAQRTGTAVGQEAIRVVDTQQLAATPRKFIGVESDGKRQFHLGGCNGFFVAGGGYMGEVVFTAESRAVCISAVRWGGLYTAESGIIHIKGHNHDLGGDFGAAIEIDSGANPVTLNGTYNSTVADNSGFPQLNQVFFPQKAYTPTYTTSGGGHSLGNGGIAGTWSRQGTTIQFSLQFSKGTTTNMGSGDMRFSLPFTPLSMSHPQVVPAQLYDGSSNTYYSATALIDNATAYATLRADGVAGTVQVDGPTPFDWNADTTLDQVRINGSYLP